MSPVTDAVIPVAGLGTRLLPATRSQPKEMLPLVDRPVVQLVVEELVACGISRVLLVTGRRKRAIEDHFDADPELGIGPLIDPRAGLQILYTRQPQPAGLGDAVRHADGFAGDRPVAVALGDAVIDSPPAAGRRPLVLRLADAVQSSGAAAAVAVAEVQDPSRYGVVALDADGVVQDMVEKPAPGTAPSAWAVMGRYVIGPEVFAALRKTEADASGEVQLTDALRQVVAGGGRVVAVALEPGERRLDIGSVEGYCGAFIDRALTHPVHGPALRARAAALLNG